MNIRLVVLVCVASVFFMQCKKADENTKTYDERLERRYCNDPLAINYNWDFPGTPDNSTCFFADEIFGGTYIVNDSIFDGSFNLDSAQVRSFPITISSIDKIHLSVSGFVLSPTCTLNNLKITADRFYRATIDSTFLPPPDSVYLGGFVVACSGDTVSGVFTRYQADALRMHIDLTLVGDTGIYYHRGTATKQ